ncbi:MAG: Dabb family protein [Clostridia bacterium]|nr:Dabb family protein [Clostridia bacterium]
MIKHIVVWRISDAVDKGKTAQIIKENLEALKEKIDVLRDIRVGINFNDTDAASDIVLETVFDSKADLQAYQEHPAHVAVGRDYVRPNVSERRVIDYEF